jgi:hypothetical protein
MPENDCSVLMSQVQIDSPDPGIHEPRPLDIVHVCEILDIWNPFKP